MCSPSQGFYPAQVHVAQSIHAGILSRDSRNLVDEEQHKAVDCHLTQKPLCSRIQDLLQNHRAPSQSDRYALSAKKRAVLHLVKEEKVLNRYRGSAWSDPQRVRVLRNEQVSL